MASFIENLRKIRGEAVYGQEMRTAIADAIEQAIDLDINGDGGVVFFTLSPIVSSDEDYLLGIQNGGDTG